MTDFAIMFGVYLFLVWLALLAGELAEIQAYSEIEEREAAYRRRIADAYIARLQEPRA